MELSTKIEQLPKIGKGFQKKLEKLGIHTVEDLIFHFPRRYEDFSRVVPISKLKLGENLCVQGKIIEIENTQTPKKKMTITEALVSDKTGAVRAIWFNQPYLTNVLKKGDFVCLGGKVVLGIEGLYFSNPAYEKINPTSKKINLLHTARLVPVYPETEGLSSRWLRIILAPILNQIREKLSDPLPEIIRKKENLLEIKEAIWQIHFPTSLEMAKRAQERFSFEEIFTIQLLVLKERLKIAQKKAFLVPINLTLCQDFIKKLPFELTLAQKRALWEILKDMEKEIPMNRLLQGDVGSGKTIVATIAFLNSAMAGFQNALMAPTGILAEQHFKTIFEFLKDYGLKIGILTSQLSQVNNEKISKRKLLEKIEKGEIQILIGTHSLIQEKVKFKKLALVVVDEQHRFGVEQRAKLTKQSDFIPHLLSMTATPIPRTLTLTIYGDLDLSLIDELPKGRKKVITKVVSPQEREKTYEFIRNEIKKGRQVFVVCPRIELDKENMEMKAVVKEYEMLSKTVFPEFKIGMLHGKMKNQEKEEVMKKFKEGKIDILVTTSVIEVGIDVPTATIIIIEGAERFGLAQLHQFRGRVGRGKFQSYCFLFTQSSGKKTLQRLKALLSCENGFELAEMDLKIRGPGDFFGTRQWGIPDLAMEGLKNIFLVEKTRKWAKEILEKDPQLKNYPLLRKKLEGFRQRVHLE